MTIKSTIADQPAFPHVVDIPGQQKEIHPGMNLRQYYAGQAMAGLLSSGESVNPKQAADYAVQYADALIEELSKPQQ